jgi:NAD(P)-dependent dehydrogenase (short-subunit alcohol dehydrogenase family)
MEPGGAALVTGAGRGIGRAVALELARRGFDTIATMRDPAAGATLVDDLGEASGSIVVERLDVTAIDSLAVPDALRVLVNNAGIELANLPVEETSLDQWRYLFETNVFGLAEVTRRVLPALRAAGGAVVCNLTSSSLLVPMPFFAAYRASKAAVSAIGESLRAELAPHGVRVVEVLPGPIATDMLEASATTPEAAGFAPYRTLAQRVAEARAAFVETATPPAEAATRIVDAILDDDAPLRSACDPLGAALLETWRGGSDESVMVTYLDGFAVDL